MWITAEMMTDLYNHDQYSRDVAGQAIQKYNEHIERCNRAIEAAATRHGSSPAQVWNMKSYESSCKEPRVNWNESAKNGPPFKRSCKGKRQPLLTSLSFGGLVQEECRKWRRRCSSQPEQR